jgi:hypothetical protein
MILRLGFLRRRTTTHFRELFCPVLSRLRRGGGGRIFQGPGSLVMDLASENFDLKDSQNFLT